MKHLRITILTTWSLLCLLFAPSIVPHEEFDRGTPTAITHTVITENGQNQTPISSMRRAPTAPPVTIWVHGTGLKSFFPWQLPQFVRKKAYALWYCPQGLTPASSLPNQHHHYKIATTLAKKASDQFPLDSFYFFGWSGKLDLHARKKAAKELYTALTKLITDYRSHYEATPRIRIVTHSHGGNVALQLADFHENKEYPFHVDELILLACPVQRSTKHLINRPFFKTIYSIHSHTDLLQIVDPQGMIDIKQAFKNTINTRLLNRIKTALRRLKKRRFFSGRHFSAQRNLIQINCKKNKRGLMHTEFLLLSFVQELPKILATIDKWKKGEYTHNLKQRKKELDFIL